MFRRERLKLREIGLLSAGIGVGLLLAPVSGRELRHAIGRRYRKTIRQMNRKTEVLFDHTEDLVENARYLYRRAQELRERGFKVIRRFRAA